MKRKLFCSIIVSALLLGGCAESVDTQQSKGGSQTVNPDSIPVGFDAYQNRTVSRSGWAGVLDNAQLAETKANGGGFGVFAYYTDLKNYDQSYVPNFMYNRGVFYNGEDGTSGSNRWEYKPIVYWPNEYGFDAASDDEDHLSFFAYAPYTPHVSAAAGSVADATYGIVGFSRNTATGDPMVRYVASFEPDKSVDLCWGVVPSDKTAWPKIQGGSTQTLAAGFPYLNMERPLETATQADATTSRIKFKFNHALAQLNVQIDTDADITTHDEYGLDGDPLGEGTKVYVRSISFTGIALQGALNLNNSVKDQALWLDWCGCTDLSYGQSVTVHDGRRDSREGASGAEAANETPTGLNPNIIQNSTPTPGVIHKYQNLFKTTSADPDVALQEAVCVIPTGEAMTITIVYDVETENPKLASYLSDGTTHGSSIENKITKTVTFGGVAGAGLESNKRYALKLHLGMNSVKFEAEVSDWATNTVNGEGWLPSNVRPILLNHTTMYLGAAQNLIATTDPTGQAVTWTYDPDVVTLSGLTPSPTRTRTITTLPGTWSTVNVIPVALGDAQITATLPSGDKAVCDVHVVPIVLTSPNNTTPSNAITETVGKKATIQLQASLFPATGSPSVTWTASPTGIVTLTPVSGDPTKCDVYGDAVGDVVITAQNGTYPTTATCNMSVTSQPPTVVNPVLTANWTYDTNAHDLIATAGTVTGGTMYYSLDGSSWYSDYNNAALQVTNAGSYPVYYKVDGDAGYDDIGQTLIGTVLVSKATPVIALSATSGTTKALGRDPQTFTATTPSTTEGAILSVSSSSTSTATASINSGTVTVKGAQIYSTANAAITVTSSATSNYNAATATYTATVDPLDISLNLLSKVADSDISGTVGSVTPIYENAGKSYYNFSQISAINTWASSQTTPMHVPSKSEWLEIIPADNSDNIFDANYTGTSNSVFSQITNTKVIAVRYINDEKCSAWQYEIVGNTLQIKSVLIDLLETTSDANTYLNNSGGSISGLSQYTSNKTLSANGRYSNGTIEIPNTCFFWTTDPSTGNSAWRVGIDCTTPSVYIGAHSQTNGDSVRLFFD